MTNTESEHVDELLDAFGSGELDAGRAARVAAHLEGCARCREELDRVEAWSGALERGFAARRRASAAPEPDWAAQRAAIVARTSGLAPIERLGRLWRWAPQVALVALAALIVGIVWRENPRESAPSRSLEEPGAAFERSAPAALEAERDDADGEPGATALDRDEPRGTPAAGESPGAARQAPAAPAAPPEALGKAREAEETPPVSNEEAAADERRAAVAGQAAEPRAEALLRAGEAEALRFERAARGALTAGDAAAARRALALWSDSLPADERRDPARAALADSLAALLDGE